MGEWQVKEVLKSDSFGRVERLEGPAGEELIRRVACGGRLPGSGIVARMLMARERRALRTLAELRGVPRGVDDEAASRAPGPDGSVPRPGEVLLRGWVEGVPLHRAEELAEDFFDHLDRLVADLHEAGVCHNDLHKEQNVMVGSDGFPQLIDFQLASWHPRGGRLFRSRVNDDLRHVQKHRRRYTRDGRGPEAAGVQHGEGLGRKRGLVALVWRRTGKHLYNFVTRRLLKTRDGEERRPDTGPWPRWASPLGQRPD